MPLADHQVKLELESAEVEAFEDFYRFLRWRADPDGRVASEANCWAAWVRGSG
jgi:hypothetical protein